MKDEKKFQDLTSEAAWPEAEKLLDGHFRQKRRRVIYLVAASFGLVVLLGTILFREQLFQSHTETQTPAVVQSTQPSVSGASDRDISPVVPAPVEKGISSPEHNPVPQESSTTSSSTSATSTSTSSTVQLNPARSKKSTKTEGTASLVASPRKQHEGSEIKSSPKQTEISAVVNSSPVVTPAISSAPVPTEKEKAAALAQNFTENNVVEPAPVSTEKEEASPVATVSVAPLVKSDSASVAASLAAPLETKNEKPHSAIGWQLGVYGGVHQMKQNLWASNTKWFDRRDREEEPAILPAFGISVAASVKAFSISVGIEYAAWGEKANYSPYSLQQKITETGNWQTYNYTIIDTDTAYIWGNQYFLHTSEQHEDSNYVTHQDTSLQNAYDASLDAARGTNKFWYVEVPVEIRYRHMFGKFGLGASAGISPAWLSRKSGSYVKQDLTGAQSVQEAGTLNTFLLNGRLSVDVYYSISPSLSIVLRPQLKSNLQSLYTSSSGFRQRYTGTGLLVGLNYTFR